MEDKERSVGPPRQDKDIQERAFGFACRVVRLHGYLSRKRPAYHSLSTQLLRAGTSVGANLEEADAAESRPDFIHKCNIALKEARESRYWLRLLAACGIVPARLLGALTGEAEQLVAILTAITRNARRNLAKAPP